jgi:hypothetical protein
MEVEPGGVSGLIRAAETNEGKTEVDSPFTASAEKSAMLILNVVDHKDAEKIKLLDGYSRQQHWILSESGMTLNGFVIGFDGILLCPVISASRPT